MWPKIPGCTSEHQFDLVIVWALLIRRRVGVGGSTLMLLRAKKKPVSVQLAQWLKNDQKTESKQLHEGL